ncbi:hypothetical protein BGZ93_005256, partial [Podila epicladia]
MIFDTDLTLTELVHIVWGLSEPLNKPEPTTTTLKPTTSTTLTPIIKTITSASPKPSKKSKPAPPLSPKPIKPTGKKFSGRGTWYSGTTSQCEHRYSQSDMIAALSEAQMGSSKGLCGRKCLITAKGSSASFVVTV